MPDVSGAAGKSARRNGRPHVAGAAKLADYGIHAMTTTNKNTARKFAKIAPEFTPDKRADGLGNPAAGMMSFRSIAGLLAGVAARMTDTQTGAAALAANMAAALADVSAELADSRAPMHGVVRGAVCVDNGAEKTARVAQFAAHRLAIIADAWKRGAAVAEQRAAEQRAAAAAQSIGGENLAALSAEQLAEVAALAAKLAAANNQPAPTAAN